VGWSVFNGPPPVVRVLSSEAQEIAEADQWLAERRGEGLAAEDRGVRALRGRAAACPGSRDVGWAPVQGA